ncbi:MAG: hypothetical protein AB4063_01740 [Crocosphaera sp.]
MNETYVKYAEILKRVKSSFTRLLITLILWSLILLMGNSQNVDYFDKTTIFIGVFWISISLFIEICLIKLSFDEYYTNYWNDKKNE